MPEYLFHEVNLLVVKNGIKNAGEYVICLQSGKHFHLRVLSLYIHHSLLYTFSNIYPMPHLLATFLSSGSR